ncbi:hypothetical protein K440DRAFT_643177 [Wilcoxina mikolae CBS 423.85]|nr:hypothetical protein K440DRAFT_643177 [Wilcoxina mikolae CBS 423.85]
MNNPSKASHHEPSAPASVSRTQNTIQPKPSAAACIKDANVSVSTSEQYDLRRIGASPRNRKPAILFGDFTCSDTESDSVELKSGEICATDASAPVASKQDQGSFKFEVQDPDKALLAYVELLSDSVPDEYDLLKGGRTDLRPNRYFYNGQWMQYQMKIQFINKVRGKVAAETIW